MPGCHFRLFMVFDGTSVHQQHLQQPWRWIEIGLVHQKIDNVGGQGGRKGLFVPTTLKHFQRDLVFFYFASCWCQASLRIRWRWITRTKTASHQNTRWPLSWLLNDAAPYLCRLSSWISIQKKRNADSRLTAKWKLPPPQKNCLVDHSLQLSKIKRALKIWILHEEQFEWF